MVIDKIAYGSSPEEIHFQYPHLTLAQIHSALAYYYDHKEQVDSEIAVQLERVDRLAELAKDSQGRRRLRSHGLL